LEKIVTAPVSVQDVAGLLLDLKKSGFNVKNIGADPGNTYVYLDPSEDKDPIPTVESWVGKIPPPVSDRSAWEKRAKELAEITTLPPSPEIARQPSLLSKIFRKILG
jgi:hypothetical protein